ncbi:hypothetical protein [Frigoriglobus tundricola]|uniref:Uncharacterized protein n=1 Tax=Frigoriglobus tundricola TaxID=2774151 RepID=A0A6M5YPK7_9BACT|nr:hypothetical protein [Frigoriglobus tundricola]QJW95987.1 hypothetical protein FTUN_3541 [Frigoriglobus tundricola]
MTPLFPNTWFAAGVITDESAADFARYAAAAPHRPARHWMWAAFRDWCEERERLTAAECRAIYTLGEGDPDANLGTAMMCRALYERTCPGDLREAAKGSDRVPVRRAAVKFTHSRSG